MRARTMLFTAAATMGLLVVACEKESTQAPAPTPPPTQAEQPVSSAGPSERLTERAGPPLKEGEYTVCHTGRHKHHLEMDDKVCIGQQPGDKKCNDRLKKWTRVALGDNERYLRLDKSELEAASDFPHGGTAMPHLVRITVDKYHPEWEKDPNVKCVKNRRIILVQFCISEGCPPELEPLHLGDTHAQN
jgi:hypothetical protein